jgi:hypothetical protein
LVLATKFVKSRLAQHQINKQLGPANGKLKTHQSIREKLKEMVVMGITWQLKHA